MKPDFWKKVNWMSVAMLIGISGILSCTLNPLTARAQTPLDPQTEQAMIDSINDEYRARAFYNAVIEKFGEVRPFSNIVHSEGNHVNLWVNLFERYGVAIPPDEFAGQMSAPDSLQAACAMGVEAEIDNVQMYDRFLEFVTQPDLQAAFRRLRQVSEERHLKAFERCQNNAGGRGGR
jgi:hypothetical protein